MNTLEEKRRSILLLRQAGMTQIEVARHLNKSERWVRKWEKRMREEGSLGCKAQSRAPHRVHNKTSMKVKEAVLQARIDLKRGSVPDQSLKYIGARAIRTVLKARHCKPLPSIATIERILSDAGCTTRDDKLEEVKVNYPHLSPKAAHVLTQVDIVPNYLKGGQSVPCFNAIDVYSRYPTGIAMGSKRSIDAEMFLIQMWQTSGVPQYTQVDNEGCFSGGATHEYVLGRVVRAALAAGTELVFSPVYHPQSNSYVERFHQDYTNHVWKETYLEDLDAVNCEADLFFDQYRESEHHRKLKEQTPRSLHFKTEPTYLDATFSVTKSRRPLYAGKVHFMRRVSPNQTVRLLNVNWAVTASADSGVWATLILDPHGCWVTIYDKAPDDESRICLNRHPFPVKEKVVKRDEFESVEIMEEFEALQMDTPISPKLDEPSLADVFFRNAKRLLKRSIVMTLEKTHQLLE